MKKKEFFLVLIFFVFFFSPKNLLAEEAGKNEINLFKGKTYLKNPMELRDPFKRKLNKKKSKGAGDSNLRENGIYSNINNNLENRSLENMKIVGVILGKERRAIAKHSDDVAAADGSGTPLYYLKEGMKVGENEAEVKAILPGGVVLVEKIKNVYDQDEYLETVIPVSGE